MNPSDASPSLPADNSEEIKFLNWIAIVAIIDVLLLIPLVWASRWFADKHDIVSILGPIHGTFFIVLVGLCLFGAIQKWWGWWFPVIVVITGGPIGSLLGDWIVRRNLKEKAA
ncbi:MAG: hypothetical protein JJE13_12630 [Thermoleophilia bacterium]|nr:hypothetical protein [Thermoleophilia bacterium]